MQYVRDSTKLSLMQRLLAFFIAILLMSSSNAQSLVRTNVLPAPKTEYIRVLITDGPVPVLETYRLFKTIIWFSWKDTVAIFADGSVHGKSFLKHADGTVECKDFSFPAETFKYSIDRCDTNLNMIRNEALEERMRSALRDSARRYSGADSPFSHDLGYSYFCDPKWRKLCHDTCAVLMQQRFDQKLNEIYALDQRKNERLNWIKTNPEKIDSTYIRAFLNDRNDCITDERSLLCIINTQTDRFINVCSALPDDQFDALCFDIKFFSSTDDVRLALTKINASPVVAKRKSELAWALYKQQRKQLRQQKRASK